MKITFGDIASHLEDPFFEVSHIGKIAIMNVTIPYKRFEGIPENFHFVNWDEADHSLIINYDFIHSEIGKLIIASTSKGICYLGFTNNGEKEGIIDLKRRFPKQQLIKKADDLHLQAVNLCNGDTKQEIHLHLKGTAFQLDVWKRLTKIPQGKLTTYALLMDDIKSARAVGTAVGDNPVSYIIPCHRVVRSDGSFQGYFWGTELKRQLLAWELQNQE